MIWGLRAVAALGLVAIPLNDAILQRLVAMVETVRRGDPFVAANAYRLQAIAWILLALQLLSITIAVDRQGDLDAGPSGPARRRLLGQRLARRAAHLRARAGLRRGRADAGRPGRDDLMAIAVKLDDLLHARRMTLTELAERVGITIVNLSILKTGKARAIRFSTLEAICAVLACQPGDILEYLPDIAEEAQAA